jgi:hypothetical protein
MSIHTIQDLKMSLKLPLYSSDCRSAGNWTRYYDGYDQSRSEPLKKPATTYPLVAEHFDSLPHWRRW